MRNLKHHSLWKIKAACCSILLCSLLLSGCGGAEKDRTNPTSGEQVEEAGTMNGEYAEEPGKSEFTTDGFAEKPGGSGSEVRQRSSAVQDQTVREILASVKANKSFWEKVWYQAGLEDGDTEEMVLQKLEQCETLELSNLRNRGGEEKETSFSLEDLVYLPNLKTLSIDISMWDVRIEDFSPISGLSRLEELSVSYEREEEIDLSFLAEMKTVKRLFLPYCRLENIDFLEDMPQLERLSLYQAPVEDLAVLEKLPELVELSVGGNAGARHIEVIGTLAKMEDLGLQDCGIEDISFLGGLKELKGVNLNDNSVTDLTPLAGLTNLERLGLSRNGIRDISPISGLYNLYDLALDENEISDISALKGLNRLNQVGLSDNQITDLSPLSDKKELIYAAVYGNPCEDLSPVIHVPMLWPGQVITEEKEISVAQWITENRPDLEEYVCIDYGEGDLNRDGRTDVAFVVEERYVQDEKMYGGPREMILLLQQKDGSWVELETPFIMESTMGGMRGDPYYGLYIGEGYLILKTAWGSSGGTTDTEIYTCRDGALWLAEETCVEDYNFSAGYDVTVLYDEGSTWCRYAIALDGYRMVRLDMETSEHPAHKAFPQVSLHILAYYIYPEMADTRLSAAEALELFREAVWPEAIREELPYEPWQRENYEQLKGIELPDYYYVYYYVIEGEEKYFYYQGLTFRDRTYYHLIYDAQGDKQTLYYVNDMTGEITDKIY